VDSDYDFFATGRPASPPAPPTQEPAPAVQQFGTASSPASPPTVNQFGTPVQATAAPAGPAAAPGYNAQDYDGLGLTGASAPPMAHRSHGVPQRVAGGGAARRPGAVLAAGVIAIVQAAVSLLGVAFAFLAVGLVTSQAAQNGLQVDSGFTGSVTLVLLVVAVIAVLYLAAGVGALRGNRALVWTLLGVEAVGLLVGLVQLATSGSGTVGAAGQLIGLALPIAAIVLLLLPGSLAWLRDR
jgi:hypothetical protein